MKIIGQGGEIGELFRNRKQYFSINVQSVSGPSLKFFNIVARWPDFHIFNQSKLKNCMMESNKFCESVLLGDGGYALTNFMMVPYRTPSTAAETLYNKI